MRYHPPGFMTDAFTQFASMPAWKRLVAQLAPLSFSVIGAAFILFDVTESLTARQSRSWPMTKGTLVVTSGQYRKNVSYRYTVDGTSYQSDRIIFGKFLPNNSRNPGREWRARSRMPTGSEVTVHYKPTDPAVSTLIPECLKGDWFSHAFGIIFLLWGIMFFFLMRMIARGARLRAA
jgi:hypothetical protein